MALSDSVDRRILEVRETRAKTLYLTWKNLTAIPDEVFTLSSLEELDLSRNSLKTVPEKLWDLPHLRRVVLFENLLESLPNRPGLVIDGATYVRFRDQLYPNNIAGLWIDAHWAGNRGEFWGAELKTLKNLRELTIGNWWLGIGGNHPAPGPEVRQILDSLASLTVLETLSLRGWDLPVVPEALQTLQGLKSLDLSSLGLKSIPDWIGHFELEIFMALENKLTAVPGTFRDLKYLKTLNLSFNPLRMVEGLQVLQVAESTRHSSQFVF